MKLQDLHRYIRFREWLTVFFLWCFIWIPISFLFPTKASSLPAIEFKPALFAPITGMGYLFSGYWDSQLALEIMLPFASYWSLFFTVAVYFQVPDIPPT